MDFSQVYNVNQDVTDALLGYKRGKGLILNPRKVTITVKGTHRARDKWVKFGGNSYKLAELQITGDYGVNSSPRPFMYVLWEKLEENRGRYAKQVINDNMQYDRHQRGWIVDWSGVCHDLENICIENLMPEVSAEMPPLTQKSEKKKADNGYGGEPPLYASGRLVECIHAVLSK